MWSGRRWHYPQLQCEDASPYFSHPRSRTASLVRGDAGVNSGWGGGGSDQDGRLRRRRASHRRKKTPQLLLVELAICPYPGAEIESKRPDFLNCLGDIFRRETTRKKYWDIDTFANRPAQRPVVSPAGTAQLFRGKPLIA